METNISIRPSQVGTAVNLLWVSLAIGLVKSIMDVQHLSAQATPAFTNYILLAVIAVMVLLIIFISKGKNWARITFLVLFAPGTLPTVPIVLAELSRAPVLGAFSVVQIILQLVALYLVFTKPGSEWFKKQVRQTRATSDHQESPSAPAISSLDSPNVKTPKIDAKEPAAARCKNPDCNRLIPPKATKCLHCGTPTNW